MYDFIYKQSVLLNIVNYIILNKEIHSCINEYVFL